MGDILYDDGRAVLDDEGVTLRRYYFPIATSKRIPYRSIRQVEAKPLGWLTGKGRGWGTADPRHWAPLDVSRSSKSTLVVRPALLGPSDPA